MRRLFPNHPRWFPAWPLFCCAALALCGCGESCKAFSESYSRSFKASYQKSFSDSCTAAAVKKGAPEGAMRSVCTCIAQYAVNHYSTMELTKMSTAPEGPEAQAMVKAASGSCELAAAGKDDATPARGSTVTAASDDKSAFGNEFKDSFASSFVSSCVDAAVKAGRPVDKVKRGCQCMARYVVGHNSVDQLMKNADPNTPSSQAMLQAAADACVPNGFE